MEKSQGLFDALPIEVVALIVEFFDAVTLCQFAAVCSKAKELSAHDAVWLALLKKDYGVKGGNEPRTLYVQKWMDAHRLQHKKKQVSALLAEAPLAVGGSSFWTRLKRKVGMFAWGEKEYRFVFCGLDDAGKTTMLEKLRINTVLTIPAIGFNVETGTLKNWNFTVWDVSGQKIRALWRHFYQNCVALLWMVDSNDSGRIEETQKELFRTILDDSLPTPYLLVYANKQDLPNALSVAELTEKLELHTLPNAITWHVQPCCATSGDGLYEGLDWLASILAKHEEDLTKKS